MPLLCCSTYTSHISQPVIKKSIEHAIIELEKLSRSSAPEVLCVVVFHTTVYRVIQQIDCNSK